MTYKFTMDFSIDGSTQKNITHILSTRGLPKSVLEIGVFEGKTTFWTAETLDRFYHDYTYYAIDPHSTSSDIDWIELTDVKSNFLHNLQSYGGDSIRYVNKTSTQALAEFIWSNTVFDFIYVDGDHRASQVLTDLSLSWECLSVGGVILCDDATDWKFTDRNGVSSAQMSPRMAIETFIMCNWDRLQIVKLPDSSQTAFVKIA